MEMKSTFEEPVVHFINIPNEDIIATSNQNPTISTGGEGDGWGDGED